MEDSSGNMHRNQTVLSQKPGLSRYWQCLLNQGRLEAIFLDLLERKGQVSVERNIKTLELITDHGSDERSKEYPISLRVHNPLSSDSSLGHIEEIHAKYVIACDGAIAGLGPNFAFLWRASKWTVSGESWTLFRLRISVSHHHSCLAYFTHSSSSRYPSDLCHLFQAAWCNSSCSS